MRTYERSEQALSNIVSFIYLNLVSKWVDPSLLVSVLGKYSPSSVPIAVRHWRSFLGEPPDMERLSKRRPTLPVLEAEKAPQATTHTLLRCC